MNRLRVFDYSAVARASTRRPLAFGDEVCSATNKTKKKKIIKNHDDNNKVNKKPVRDTGPITIRRRE